jgi:hypothetical protein
MESLKKEKSPRFQQNDEVVLSEDEKRDSIRMLERLMELGLLEVWGDEDDLEERFILDCEDRKQCCRAICCSFIFALTKEEQQKGTIQWNPKRPYFIAREDDGFCPHLDRTSLKCKIWEDCPKRCQKYNCGKELNVWIDFKKKIINKEVFKHLPKKS